MGKLLCSDPFHDSRAGEDGWVESLGTVAGPDKRIMAVCAACAKHREPVEDKRDPLQRVADIAGVSRQDIVDSLRGAK
jgi:hypothetical protein